MGLFSKRDPEAMVKKGGKYYCPFCGADLDPLIDEQAKSMYSVFARMGPLAGAVTMDTVKKQICTESGIECTCGKSVKPRK